MTDEAQGAAQDNTNATQQGNEGADNNQAQIDSQNASNSANDGGENNNTQTGADNQVSDNQNSEMAKPPETAEELFAKDYIGKPETGYDFKDVSLPEGMEFNKELTDELTDFAGKLNLSQKGADKFMTMGVKIADNAQQKTIDAIVNDYKAQSQKFFEVLKADPEIGGNKLGETVRVADIAYKPFIQNVDDEAHKAIMSVGLLNNRSFVNAFYQMGLQMQDGSINSGSPSGGVRTANDWYPNMPQGKSAS